MIPKSHEKDVVWEFLFGQLFEIREKKAIFA